jgi:asparagine synthase (glutamine-hydrolysing)
MCGISGIISSSYTENKCRSVVQGMNQMLAHRGPDNDGIWQEEHVCLGHRRLSIIDLSPESNQPLLSNDQRYVIVYNGELYNYRELKLQLQGAVQGSTAPPYFFKTESDTEVVLAAFIRWGSQCLQYFNGMYAFAIYDTVEKQLFIARDRIGVKPLYYYYGEDAFLFASEIRPIIHSGIKQFSLNREAVAEYFAYQTVHAPNTIIKGIKMLLPGHYLEYKDGKASISQYYTVNKIQSAVGELPYGEICSGVNKLLTHSVQQRMVSDVPFGAFLSGGIDSSAVVGLMSKVSAEPINTFNISFDETEFSESIYARLIAKRFNTRHHEIKLKPQDFLEDLPEALAAMDHPGGDGPNTYVVSKATRKAGITMALSGIGGDELFAGYDVFKRMSELQHKTWLNNVPLFARKAAGFVLRKKEKSVRANKIAELISQKEISLNSAYPLNRSVFTKDELATLLRSPDAFKQINAIVAGVPQIKGHLLTAVSLCEIRTYLQNVLLRDTDQMSMAVALEVREPFLDFQLLEFVLGVKDEDKYPHTPKKLLTDSLGDLLPQEIIMRPKMGFTLPWQHWLRKELKSLCEKNMSELASRDFCNKNEVLSLWHRFLAKDKTVSWSRIWHLVVLNVWLKQNNIEY